MVMTAELGGYDQHACVARAQHELELALPEDRHQRLADRAEPERGQRDRDELEQVGQLVGDRLACFDAELEQQRRPALRGLLELAEAPLPQCPALTNLDDRTGAGPLAGVLPDELGDQPLGYVSSPGELGTSEVTAIGIPSAFM